MATTFTVTGQTTTQAVGANGVVAPAIEVAFTTKPNNIAGRVTIPQSLYTTDAVRSAVEAQAAILESVQAL